MHTCRWTLPTRPMRHEHTSRHVHTHACTQVDSTDPAEFAKAMRPNTRVVYTESPANPTCRLTDLEAVSALVIDKSGTHAGHQAPKLARGRGLSLPPSPPGTHHAG